MKRNEEALRNIFYELVGAREITLLDSPKDIGLDSLQMVILVAKIETTFDIEISDDYLDIEHFKTIGSILDMINQLT